MDKHTLSASELAFIAHQHAYMGGIILNQHDRTIVTERFKMDALMPFITMMYTAFDLLLRAFLEQQHIIVKGHKTLHELIELNEYIHLSQAEKKLISLLCKQYAFRKGLEYDLWADNQSLHVFCDNISTLYQHLKVNSPVELEAHYER